MNSGKIPPLSWKSSDMPLEGLANQAIFDIIVIMCAALVSSRDRESSIMVAEISLKRQEILKIAARHGVTRIRVFGSAARGEAGPESDVDFLIDVDEQLVQFVT